MARKANGMSQKELACELKVSCPTVSDWESGKKNPSIANLQRLSEVLNVTTDYLLGKDSEQKKEPAANAGGELSGIDAELYDLLMGLPDDKLQDAMRYVRYLKSLPDNE